jgi:hypothetical protein
VAVRQLLAARAPPGASDFLPRISWSAAASRCQRLNKLFIEWSRRPIAQLRYNPVALSRTLYWPDRNTRWHLGDFIKLGSVDDLLAEIEKDPLGIFWD